MKFSAFVESKTERIFVIMRGFCGSGKSTKINAVLSKYGGDHSHVLSADNYFIPMTLQRRNRGQTVSPKDELEEYRSNWSNDKLYAAHTETFTEFQYLVDNGVTPIILDNMNIVIRDFKHYAEYADKAEYKVKVEEPESPWWIEHRKYLSAKSLSEADLRKLMESPEFKAELAAERITSPKQFKEHIQRKLDKLSNILFQRNTHGVPLSAIQKIIGRWQNDINIDELLGKKKT